jgi:hypothetical protein
MEVTELKVGFSIHGHVWTFTVYCCICSAHGTERRVRVKCKEYYVGLCVLVSILKLTTPNLNHDTASKSVRNLTTYLSKQVYNSHLLTLVPRSWIFVPWRWRRYVPPKRQLNQDLHSATSQKMTFFIVTAVKTSNLTEKSFILHVSFNALQTNAKETCLWSAKPSSDTI